MYLPLSPWRKKKKEEQNCLFCCLSCYFTKKKRTTTYNTCYLLDEPENWWRTLLYLTNSSLEPSNNRFVSLPHTLFPRHIIFLFIFFFFITIWKTTSAASHDVGKNFFPCQHNSKNIKKHRLGSELFLIGPLQLKQLLKQIENHRKHKKKCFDSCERF